MRLHAVERGAGAPVALLHGLFGQAANFASVQRRLAAEGRRVIALDLRNHGASPHAPTMTYPAMADDVLETLRALQALPCTLVGHSMGGKTAMWAALAAPAAVARLLIADIAPVAYEHAAQHAALVAALASVPLRPGMTRAAAEAILAERIPDAKLRGFLLQNLAMGETPRWRINLPAIAAALPDLVGWPEAVTAVAPYSRPTLFLAGARSDYIRPDHRSAIRALFPRARLAVLKNAGHWLHADDPDGFVAAVTAFLSAT